MTLIHILEAWAALCAAFITYRAWAGGMFSTGLERSKPLEDESWCSPENHEFR